MDELEALLVGPQSVPHERLELVGRGDMPCNDTPRGPQRRPNDCCMSPKQRLFALLSCAVCTGNLCEDAVVLWERRGAQPMCCLVGGALPKWAHTTKVC